MMEVLMVMKRTSAIKFIMVSLVVLVVVGAAAVSTHDRNWVQTTIHPQEYAGAVRNPMKGFMERTGPVYGYKEPDYNEWSTLIHSYIPWNALEDNADDTIEKISQWCDAHWKDQTGSNKGFEQYNIKVVPRIYLDWPDDDTYWPSDMKSYDYSSDQFKERVQRLVERLGKLWNHDPRVAFIQMGIVGKWGEQHSPSPDATMQKFLGELFKRNFPDKLVEVRYAISFIPFGFGYYWDSFGVSSEGNDFLKYYVKKDLWQTQIMSGEVSYNFGDRTFVGQNATATMYPEHRYYLINEARRLHTSALMWVGDYGEHDDESAAGSWDPQIVAAGAEEIQKNLGYRFIVTDFSYPKIAKKGQPLDVSFKVRNDGSAPFYYNWPVELSLLDPDTKTVVWKQPLKTADITTWLPGTGFTGGFTGKGYPPEWGAGVLPYVNQPQEYEIKDTFTLPKEIRARKKYIIQLAVLDPAGNLPSLRFSIRNYFNGGYHPMGYMGIGIDPGNAEIDANLFDNMNLDDSLHYRLDWHGG